MLDALVNDHGASDQVDDQESAGRIDVDPGLLGLCLICADALSSVGIQSRADEVVEWHFAWQVEPDKDQGATDEYSRPEANAGDKAVFNDGKPGGESQEAVVKQGLDSQDDHCDHVDDALQDHLKIIVRSGIINCG